MNLLLIDNRVGSLQTVMDSLLQNTVGVVFDYYNDSFASILEKIPAREGGYSSLGIFQENYNEPTYRLLASMDPASLETSISDFSSWTSLVDFFRAIREKTGIFTIDMMGCNIGSDVNWLAAIAYMSSEMGVSIASSVDATGGEAAGGNWILETANTDLVGKYFTEGIQAYEFVLGPTSAHTVLLTASGEVYSMGSNTSGCSGLGTAYLGYSTITEPMRLGVSGITGVSYGTSNTFLLNSAGQVLCCGLNTNGQLGLGNTTAQTDLSFVRADVNNRLSNVAAVAAGANHSVFLLTDGSALSCGLNTDGQLGDGTITQRTYPVKLPVAIIPPLSNYSLLAYYKFDGNLKNEVSGITSPGGTFSSSIFKSGTQSVGTTSQTSFSIQDVNKSSGSSMTVSVWFYYSGTAYRQGWFWVSSTTTNAYRAFKMQNGEVLFLSGSTYTLKASYPTNEWHHLAIVGSSTAGQTYLYYDGTLVNTIAGNSFSETQLKSQTVLGFNTDGVNGYMDDMRFYEAELTQSDIQYLYNNANIPSGSPSVQKILYISAGNSHTLLSDTSTNIFSCGLNANGQLGTGTLTSSYSATQVKINASTNLTGISRVAAGGSHSLALTTSNTVYSWGANTQGQLGNNTNTDASFAVLVLTSGGATLTGITQIAAGTSHSLFLTASGTVFACGLNTSGQLGNNSTTNSNQLVSVLNPAGTAALTGISKIFASANTSFFLTSSGILYGCGSNASNQLGFPNSGTTIYSLPVQINLVDFGKARLAGYTALYNRSQGAEPWQQQYYGESALNIGIAGYSATDLSNSGFTATSLKAAGLVSQQLALVGFSEEQAYPPSFINSTASLSAVPTFFTKRENGDFIQSITTPLHSTKIYDVSASSHYVSGDTAELPPSAFADTLYWSSDAVWNASTGAYAGSKSTTIDGSTYNGEWLQIQLPVAIRLSSYSFIPIASRTPTTFYLAGSSDGTTWTLLDTRTAVTTTAGSTNRYTTTTTATQYYHYYRFVVAAIQATNAGYVSLRQFKLNTTVRGKTDGISITDLSLAGYDAMEMIMAGNPISSILNSGVAIPSSVFSLLTLKQFADNGYNYSNIVRVSDKNIIKLAPTTVPTSKVGTLMSGGLLDAPRSVTVSGRDASSISVAISGPGFSTGLTGYSVSAVPVTGGSTVAKSLGVAGTLVDGLAAGKIYDLQVRSTNTSGNSTAVVVRNSTGLVLPTLSVGAITHSTIDISFSTALSAQDCSYALRTDPHVTRYVLAPGATSQSLTGLASLTNYNIILDASNIYTSVSRNISATTNDYIISASAKTSLNGAYSVYLINTSYTGPTLRIRRSSDSVTADFYADVNGNLGTALNATGTSYTSWIGASTGFVSTWYDQSGKGNNATQTTTTAQPSLNYTGKFLSFTNTSMVLPDSTIPTGNSAYTSHYKHGTSTSGAIYGSGTFATANASNNARITGGQYNHYWWGNDFTFGNYSNGNTITETYDPTLSSLHRKGYINGSLSSSLTVTTARASTTGNNKIGEAHSSAEKLNGELYHLLIFSQALPTNDLLVIHNKTSGYVV